MTAYGLNALRLNVATRRFFAGASGNSVVEYALLLAIIAGALLTAATVVGFVARDTLSVAGATVGGKIAADADGAGNSAAPRQPPRSTASAPPVISLYTVSYVQLGVVAIVVLLSGLLWHRLRKNRGANEKEPEEAEPEHAEPRLNHDAIFEKRQAIYNILTNDMQAMFESRILVGHLMSRHVTKVAPGDATDDVVELMREKRLRHLLVCDRDGRLLGIISDRDLAKSSAGTAAELMTRDPITVEPDTLVSPAVTLLIQRRISCLPVVDSDGVLRGVLTTTDLMMTLQCAMQILQRIAKEVKSPLREPEATTISSVCA